MVATPDGPWRVVGEAPALRRIVRTAHRHAVGRQAAPDQAWSTPARLAVIMADARKIGSM